MTPQNFISKWRNNTLKERSASQSHFNDLSALPGVLDQISADPKGEWFAFEKGAPKIAGGAGWADVWRKGCFAWEYKGQRKDLEKAFAHRALDEAVADAYGWGSDFKAGQLTDDDILSRLFQINQERSSK